MSGWLIALVGVIYLIVAIDLLLVKKDVGLSIAFLGYTIGNIGLYMKAVQ